ncbi:MAG: Na(+)-translocating NADH-quinone reductase subunit B [Chlamydiales bacterium]|nr:Na(+)-translocating NADH-quinone reductase subunit B [Chlamydiales bacterium]MCH9635505.1 Na(+)-translocating NADH-quinone reductase subunit B [Chlamydiales bacterium]
MNKICYSPEKMLRRFLDFQLSLVEKGKPLHKMRPLVSAIDTFCYEPALNTSRRPFVRDAVDLKRWMFLVVLALFPTILMALWNSGVQQMVYQSGDLKLMDQYLDASQSFKGYFAFTLPYAGKIFALGAIAFVPLMLISYLVGGICEGIFASVRNHEIAEGFLVTGMLYPLILPPTIPYWQAALGIAFGVIVGKELFGGTGMNILNPALTARAFLFFTFPGNMSGDVWVGTNQYEIAQSVNKVNQEAHKDEVDGYSQATVLQGVNQASPDIKRIHVAAIATQYQNQKIGLLPVVQKRFDQWKKESKSEGKLGELSQEQLRAFLMAPMAKGGLALAPGSMAAAYSCAESIHGGKKFSNGNLFFGNIPGSLGETSTLACLLGAIMLLVVGVGSWRNMLSFGLSAFITAWLFSFFSSLGDDMGAWNSARYAMPALRQLMAGGLAFGLVYMATDPVSSAGMKSARWIYGGLIGLVTILIRVINPAYPEGVMLAILFANVFAPLFDYYAVRRYRRKYVN